MQLLGVNLSLISKQELLDTLLRFLEDGKSHHIVTTNPEFIVEAQSNVAFRRVLNSADISLVDGVGILCAIDYAQHRKQVQKSILSYWTFFRSYWRVGISKKSVVYEDTSIERITGVDLTWLLVQQEWMKGRKLYLLGGADSVSSVAMRRLQQVNPDIQFRSSNGVNNVANSDDRENAAVIADINNFNPDVLLVAYGHPWQDLWIEQYRSQLRFRIAVGVGGTFDYIAGRVPRAPAWMRSIGLEWLFRLVKQPQRYRRILNATWVFVRKVISSDRILS